MRVCRFLVLLVAVAAAAGCARRPAQPYAQAQRSDLDMMTYGAPAQYRQPPMYGQSQTSQTPGYAAQAQAGYAPPQGYAPRPAPGYVPSYAPPPSAYGPPPYPSRTVRAVTQYVPVREMPEDTGPYTLDTGDKLRIVVFGQDTLSNTYSVDAAGHVTLPLIGAVQARDMTTSALGAAIRSRLASGYIREPSVAVEVDVYRPFFVLGEVTYPGQYPFVPHMTVENAVAIAGGFTPRATKTTVTVTRKIQGVPQRFPLPLRYTLRPGDVVTVGERWF
jgi:polysaccharide export outer membrane protein